MSQYVFGPVPSRRLGRSLGIDLLPLKTCSFNCVYCQVGRTTCLTIERGEWVPTGPVLDQVRQKIAGPIRPDVITFSGSGEPTLHSGIGEIIRGIKSFTQIPVVVLTNGSLLWMPEVRRDLLQADIVVPSLDACSESLFQYVNRPPGYLPGKTYRGNDPIPRGIQGANLAGGFPDVGRHGDRSRSGENGRHCQTNSPGSHSTEYRRPSPR